MTLGPAEILVILVLALIVFGPKRLPEVGRQVGGALREIRKVQTTVRAEIDQAMREPTPTLPPKPETDEVRAFNRAEGDADHTDEPELVHSDDHEHHEHHEGPTRDASAGSPDSSA